MVVWLEKKKIIKSYLVIGLGFFGKIFIVNNVVELWIFFLFFSSRLVM